MLEISEVWYFSRKEGVFSRNDSSIAVPAEQYVLVLMNIN
jgi:hypothetical protein